MSSTPMSAMVFTGSPHCENNWLKGINNFKDYGNNETWASQVLLILHLLKFSSVNSSVTEVASVCWQSVEWWWPCLSSRVLVLHQASTHRLYWWPAGNSLSHGLQLPAAACKSTLTVTASMSAAPRCHLERAGGCGCRHHMHRVFVYICEDAEVFKD